ncbi:hypothetical protein MSAN_00915400 [Mycena sanguinolenta]|uniref:Uncharacterized protein n=1 Tax=Mycena sanguinolenta TaxID=230812 RepID=A0A8H7D8W2_9AGAR|nr:hypothetical protein MSAN_00915400 [Mycena sanguinolenta]
MTRPLCQKNGALQAHVPSHRRHIPRPLSALLDGRAAPRGRHQLDAPSVNRNCRTLRTSASPALNPPVRQTPPASRTRRTLIRSSPCASGSRLNLGYFKTMYSSTRRPSTTIAARFASRPPCTQPARLANTYLRLTSVRPYIAPSLTRRAHPHPLVRFRRVLAVANPRFPPHLDCAQPRSLGPRRIILQAGRLPGRHKSSHAFSGGRAYRARCMETTSECRQASSPPSASRTPCMDSISAA